MSSNDEYASMEAGIAMAKEKHEAAMLDVIAEAGRRMFVRECQAAGIDPGGMASPGLLKLVGWVPPKSKRNNDDADRPENDDFGGESR